MLLYQVKLIRLLCGYQPHRKLSFISLNFSGTSGDELSFAHEMGHAIYSLMSDEYQSVFYCDISPFLQEIIAVLNEIIVIEYRRSNSKTKKERLFYTEIFIEMVMRNYYINSVWVEFEESIYVALENGEILNAKKLNDILADCYYQIYKESLDETLNIGNLWIENSHLYHSNYMYQYSSAMVYAIKIYHSLKENNAFSEVLVEFLKQGNSKSIKELLSFLKLDIEEQELYNTVNVFFEILVEEFILESKIYLAD